MRQSFEAELLTPLSYRTRPDSGAGGASVTGAFLGDIALDYAIHYARYGGDDLWDGRLETTPKYKEDFVRLHHRCTVGTPSTPPVLLPLEYHATSFVSEGYPLVEVLTKRSPSSSMKNWMQRQSLAPFNKFSFAVFSKDNDDRLPSRFTIRMGNGRETLVALREQRVCAEKVTLNAFTLRKVLERDAPSGLAFSMENARYLLIHGVPIDEAEEAMGWG